MVTDHGGNTKLGQCNTLICKRLPGAADPRQRPASCIGVRSQASSKGDVVPCDRLHLMCLALDLQKKVNGFSLNIAWEMRNELTVLFGCSGSGKSLTLQMVAGLIKPDCGHIHFKGQVFFNSEVRINLPPQQRSLGYVFQHLALFPHMTVKENILYGAGGLSGDEKKKRCASLVESFGLEGLENKFPSEISGGQKQRVAFARALIRRPDVLLLDEPFSALDSPLRREMCGFLRKVRIEFGLPVVLVTHDPAEARTLADRIIVYDRGRIAQTGTPDDVFTNPANEEVARLVGLH
jgi:molybdate transport system ATP-binding protein